MEEIGGFGNTTKPDKVDAMSSGKLTLLYHSRFLSRFKQKVPILIYIGPKKKKIFDPFFEKSLGRSYSRALEANGSLKLILLILLLKSF